MSDINGAAKKLSRADEVASVRNSNLITRLGMIDLELDVLSLSVSTFRL